MKYWFCLMAACQFVLSASPSSALTGNSVVLRSNGFNSGSNWTLQDNGYVGTYIDLAVWSAGYGGGALAAALAVPEPSSFVLLTISAILVSRRRL